MLWWGMRNLLRFIAWLGRLLYGLEAQGLGHLPTQGPLIIFARRISRVDFIAGAMILPVLREFSGMTGAIAISNNRWISWVARELGILPTLKGKGLSAISLMDVYRLLQQGKILVLPDEGEVPWDGRLQPLRGGAAWLALRTRAPIVTVLVYGGYAIWPRWAPRPHLTGKLVIKIGEPFYLCDTPADRVTHQMLHKANQCLTVQLKALSVGYLLTQGNEG
jgi:1-acyl-sn-glycerol-3-phosphate acyltransferase